MYIYTIKTVHVHLYNKFMYYNQQSNPAIKPMNNINIQYDIKNLTESVTIFLAVTNCSLIRLKIHVQEGDHVWYWKAS